jgi:cytosine/creatinine deaminase
VIERGLQGRVTLSHLCVLAALDAKAAAALIDKLAHAEITVVALPETNLFLQERGETTPVRRGITRVRELLDAGVKVRLGTDNICDWFFPFGDGDMLETARMAAVAAHLDDVPQLIAAACDGRRGIEEGDAADLVLIQASSFDDALAGARASGSCSRGDGKLRARAGITPPAVHVSDRTPSARKCCLMRSTCSRKCASLRV